MGNPVVDVIVPVYRPDDKFYKLLQQLKQQTWPVHRIILMNTEKKFWDEFWKTRAEHGELGSPPHFQGGI